MRSLEEKIKRFNEVVIIAKDGPPNEITQKIKKNISDIRDLLIKADAAMEVGKSPASLFDRIDELLDIIDQDEQSLTPEAK